jgi:hypothetical protein
MQQTMEPGPTATKKKKKKRKSNVPRHKRLNRTARLAVAKEWIEKYEGKRIVLSYAKYFAVDHLCAVAELRKLGVPIDPEYERQLRVTAAGKAKARAERRARRAEEEAALRDEFDEISAYEFDDLAWQHYCSQMESGFCDCPSCVCPKCNDGPLRREEAPGEDFVEKLVCQNCGFEMIYTED